jgi:predicted RNA-binding Zn-ribbon protein involved in translation (DUF1610 family)
MRKFEVCYDSIMENKDPVSEDNSGTKFECPNCGVISRDDVVFLCNTCERGELIFKDGIYMCPACLSPGENFQCMICDSREVKMIVEK